MHSSRRCSQVGGSLGGFPGVVRRFEAIADAIIYRWSVEHDVSATPTEVAEAREYAYFGQSEHADRFIVDAAIGPW
jgi:hypothetical protein